MKYGTSLTWSWPLTARTATDEQQTCLVFLAVRSTDGCDNGTHFGCKLDGDMTKSSNADDADAGPRFHVALQRVKGRNTCQKTQIQDATTT